MKLIYFIQPEILQRIGVPRLFRLLDEYAGDLQAANIRLPILVSENDDHFASVAAIMATPARLPERLRTALLTLEAAASPENQDRLNAAIQRRFPNVSLTSCPLDRLPDSAGNPLEAIWDQEWRTTLLEAALAAVKARVDPSQWQIFDLYALKRWPVGDVVKALGVSAGRVYIARHRITLLLKKQIKALERG